MPFQFNPRKTSAVLVALLLMVSVHKTAHATSDEEIARDRLAYLLTAKQQDFVLLRQRAKSGDPTAMALLGEAYGQGFGGLKLSFSLASAWLRKAEAKGVPGASKEADYYDFRERFAGIISQGAQALVDTEKLIAQRGEGSQTSDEPPSELLKRMGNLGVVEAQLALGDMAALGIGQDRNPDEAAKWYGKAITSGSALGHYDMARLIRTTQTGPLPEAEALKEVRLAADKGLADAQSEMGQYFSDVSKANHDTAEGLKWYLLAASSGSTDAKEEVRRITLVEGPYVSQEAEHRADEWRHNRALEAQAVR